MSNISDKSISENINMSRIYSTISKVLAVVNTDAGNENIMSKYRCINRHDSYASALNEGGRGANGLEIEFSEDKTIFTSFTINGAKDRGVDNTPKGGIIVFSTDANSVNQDDNTILDSLKEQIDRVAVDIAGWAVGRYLNGRYTGRDGKQYGNNSLSVMLVGIPFDKLIKIAEELCASFTQESVLAKDLDTNRILFVNPE